MVRSSGKIQTEVGEGKRSNREDSTMPVGEKLQQSEVEATMTTEKKEKQTEIIYPEVAVEKMGIEPLDNRSHVRR